MNIFDVENYKEILKFKIQENQNNRGYQTRLAAAAGCSRSFLSQVLADHLDIDITRDQAAGLCVFWNFNDSQFEYFLLLLDLEKAKSQLLKDHLQTKMKKVKKEQLKLPKEIAKESISEFKSQSVYYSSWLIAAVHMALTIPALQDPKVLGQRLNLDDNQIEKVLLKLQEFGLAKNNGAVWESTKKDINLDESSELSSANHIHWRNKAISKLYIRKADSIHFSSVFSISKKDKKILNELIKNLIIQSRDLIIKSKEEELYCVNIDCFEV